MKDDPTKDTGEWFLARRQAQKEKLEAKLAQLEAEMSRLLDEKHPSFSFRPMLIGFVVGMVIGRVLGLLLL